MNLSMFDFGTPFTEQQWGYRLLTVEIGLVRVVHQHAVVLRVADAVTIDVRIAFVSFAVAIRIQLIGIRYFWTIIHAVLNAVSANPRKFFFFFFIKLLFPVLLLKLSKLSSFITCLCRCRCRKRRQ